MAPGLSTSIGGSAFQTVRLLIALLAQNVLELGKLGFQFEEQCEEGQGNCSRTMVALDHGVSCKYRPQDGEGAGSDQRNNSIHRKERVLQSLDRGKV